MDGDGCEFFLLFRFDKRFYKDVKKGKLDFEGKDGGREKKRKEKKRLN